MRRKLVFNGWGSKDLLEFLASIGKETAEQLSQHEVVWIISKYCADHNLFDPEKRKRILCDAKLQTLFRRKWINKNGIHTHVEKHFAENQYVDDDAMEVEEQVDQGLEVGEGSGENYVVSGEKRKRKSRPEADCQKMGKGVMVVRRGLFASVTAENIKHVYLRRNVLDELMKEPESFDAKVFGCFVRIKTEPSDYCRTTSHLLVLVTGVKRSPGNAEMGDSVLLEVPCVLKDVPISEVSDDNFTEDECEDLRQRVKDGLLKRPLVADFQEKAQSLHEVITRDWIVRELAIIKHRIDQASEKGWRKELLEYWETWSKLKTPEEQYRLIKEIPKIIADEEEAESACKEIPRHEEQAVILQPEVSIKVKPSKFLIRAGTWSPGNVAEATGSGNVTKAAASPPARTASLSPTDNAVEKIKEGIQKADLNTGKQTFLSPDNVEKTRPEDIHKKAAKTTEKETPAAAPFVMEKSREMDAPNMTSQKTEKSTPKKIEIIDLSNDDDEGDNMRPAAIRNQATATAAVVPTENVNAKMWRCMSVKQGLHLGGLYPISLLKKWRDSSSNPSALHVKVWKEGQREEEAILLEEAIRQAYGLK